MTLALDHLVIAVSDLPRAIADYTALGFTVLEGGRHPGRPTHNALVVFEDGSYLELIAWHSPGLDDDRWWQWLKGHGEGLVDVALHPDDVARVVARAKAGDVALGGPYDGGRARPDGEILQWQTARHITPDLPFLCGDITPRHLRVQEGEVRRHANGVTGVASVTLVVEDLNRTLARYRILLGEEAVWSAPWRLATTGLQVAQLRLPAHPGAESGATLILIEPDRGSTAESARALSTLLRQRGEGVLAFTLRGARSRDQFPWPGGSVLPQALTHGAVIEYEP